MNIDALLDEHDACMAQLRHMEKSIIKAGNLLRERLDGGKKIMICGNGGSAADKHTFLWAVCRQRYYCDSVVPRAAI